MIAVRVSPGAAPPRAEVTVPGSKSITNRALLLAALAEGESTLLRPLLADDTDAMCAALRALGATVAAGPGGELHVTGLAGPPQHDAEVYCGMAGTVARFLLPALAAGDGRFLVDAHPQLRRRPLGPVLEALVAQGAYVDAASLPLVLLADGLTGGELVVDASVSSQFLSGLLMAAPLARAPLLLRFGALVSRPYLELTIRTMAAFGVEVEAADGALAVAPGRYRATRYEVEPDASTASYFLAAAALNRATVSVPGLDLDATAQGDAELVAVLERMGCTVSARGPVELSGPERLRGLKVDMGDSSDVFMTLACVAPFAGSPTTIEGIAHARVKESDRIAATAENLRRLSVQVEEGADYLRIHPGVPRQARLPTYGDHRIAMAFALIGTRVPVELEAPEVVAKTCPSFWELWPATGASVEVIE